MTPKLEYLKRIWNEKAVVVQKEPLTLRSRRISHIYVNHRNFICLPENMDVILSLFEESLSKISDKPFALCNVNSSVSPILVGALSLRTRIPFYFYRHSSDEKGLSQCIFTYDSNPSSRSPQRLPAVLIDDVVTTTTTIRATSIFLQDAGIDVIGALILMDRRIRSEKGNEPIKIYPIVSFTEIIEYGMNNVISDREEAKLLVTELDYLQR